MNVPRTNRNRISFSIRLEQKLRRIECIDNERQQRLFCRVRGDLGNQVLKDVSRSFYLSLRLLPEAMREAASIGYMLARSTDTIADSARTESEQRLGYLRDFAIAIRDGGAAPRWPMRLLNAVSDIRERKLLEHSGDVLAALHALPDAEAGLVRDVLATIVSGQEMDITRFCGASREHPVCLASEDELEDYTWRVAGCVGAFWTKLGFLTLGERFSLADPAVLEATGVSYGKGLQLVNILRDFHEDRAAGRCYLPINRLDDSQEIQSCHSRWAKLAESRMDDGEVYAGVLLSRRLRGASVLPALIGRETLERMKLTGAVKSGLKVKVPRYSVYRALIHAFFLRPSER